MKDKKSIGIIAGIGAVLGLLGLVCYKLFPKMKECCGGKGEECCSPKKHTKKKRKFHV